MFAAGNMKLHVAINYRYASSSVVEEMVCVMRNGGVLRNEVTGRGGYRFPSPWALLKKTWWLAKEEGTPTVDQYGLG